MKQGLAPVVTLIAALATPLALAESPSPDVRNEKSTPVETSWRRSDVNDHPSNIRTSAMNPKGTFQDGFEGNVARGRLEDVKTSFEDTTTADPFAHSGT